MPNIRHDAIENLLIELNRMLRPDGVLLDLSGYAPELFANRCGVQAKATRYRWIARR